MEVIHIMEVLYILQLTPDDKDMVEEHKLSEEAAQEYARKANVISTKDKDKDKEKKEEKDEEQKEKDMLSDKKYNDNQKVQLCVALLEVRHTNVYMYMYF